MILTKDNLLRAIKEKKYVTPTTISEIFETSTMIASAALSELAKDKLIKISDLKLGSSPYYYDPAQKEFLVEIGKKHFSGYDKEALNLLEEKQVVNDASLSIQLRLAIERISDFSVPLEIEFENRRLKFWVWYMRDIKETQAQILDAIKGKSEPIKKETPHKKEPVKKEVQKNIISELNPFSNSNSEQESKVEQFIEEYFKTNYLKIENKTKQDKFIRYTNSISVNKIKIVFDSIYYFKKPQESEVLKFYTSSNKPKIVFVESAPKKLFKLAENMDNLTIVNV